MWVLSIICLDLDEEYHASGPKYAYVAVVPMCCTQLIAMGFSRHFFGEKQHIAGIDIICINEIFLPFCIIFSAMEAFGVSPMGFGELMELLFFSINC